MDKKTTGIVATVVTALLCGCCALFSIIMGLSAITGNGRIISGDAVQPMPPSNGYVLLCLSVFFIAVPIIVGFFTLRKKPEDAAVVDVDAEPVSDEPLPPAS